MSKPKGAEASEQERQSGRTRQPGERNAARCGRTGQPEFQVRFDGGHQQRYLPDRQAVLRYVLAVGPRAASPRFEIFAEGEPVRLADGSDGGRRFRLVEVIDLGRPGEIDRLRQEMIGDSQC